MSFKPTLKKFGKLIVDNQKKIFMGLGTTLSAITVGAAVFKYHTIVDMAAAASKEEPTSKE